MLTLLYGTKSAREEIYKKISSDVSEDRRAYLIVPDQKALLAEEALTKKLPSSAALLVDAVGFSRLANLVCRKYGSLTYRYATDGAKAIIMHSALKKLSTKLKVFGGELQGGILEALCALMREFRTCSLSAETLYEGANKLAPSPLGDKLHDLALIFTEYEDALHKNFAEVEDDLDTLANLLEVHDFFEGASVYIDSFISFTKQELTIISRMLSRGVNVTVALPFSRSGAHMAECRDTRKKLLSLCAKLSAKVTEETIADPSPAPLAFAKEALWDFANGETFAGTTENVLEVVHCADKNEEAKLCLKEIYQALLRGESFSDIAIIARDAESYTGILDRLLDKCNLPFFFSKKTDASLLPLTSLILSAFSLYVGDFKVSDVTSYIKSGLCGLSDDECDIFEEYVTRWNVNGRDRYLDGEDFTMSPLGYSQAASNEDTLKVINEAKKKLALPLMRFCDSLDGAKNVLDFATATYEYLSELGVREASQQDEIVRYFGASRTEDAIRLWNITLDALDTLVEASDDSQLTASEFCILVKILFSAIDIAHIPTSKDQIIIGNADTVRIDERSTVIILGAVEGVFPAAVSESPTLCENERKELDEIGITLSQNLLLRSAREFFHFVRAIDFASKRAVISYYTIATDGKSARPSFAVTRLKKLFPALKEYSFSSLDALDRIYFANAASEDVGIFDARTEAALKEVLTKSALYTEPLKNEAALSNGISVLDEAIAKEIYGSSMTLSQSKIDTYSDCKFRHFLRYVLKLEETEAFEFNPSDTGTYVHSILENFVRSAMDEGKRISDYTDEEIDELAKTLSEKETEKILSRGGTSARVLCFFERMYRNLRLILKNLVEEFKASSFEPYACEYKIGIGKDSHKPLVITLSDGATVSLNGIADRIGVYKADGKVYLRIVDYKTGDKPFSEKDLEKGKNLQLLIYLFTLCKVADKTFLESIGADTVDETAPAGVVYFVVKAPEIKLDTPLTEDGLLLAEGALGRKGFVFDADKLAEAIDKSGDKLFLSPLKKKDGEDVEKLYETVCASITKVAENMRGGRIDTLETATVGQSTPCRYCEYTHICRHCGTNTDEGENVNA